jgi:hypothetical protein
MEETDSARLTPSEGRRFAWTLAVAFAVIAAIAEWRGREWAAFVFGVLAVLFFAAGLGAPTRMGPVERAWMGMARAISRVTTPIFMAVVYFVVLTPTGLLRRAFTRRGLSPSRESKTFWIERQPVDRETLRRRMERQF